MDVKLAATSKQHDAMTPRLVAIRASVRLANVSSPLCTALLVIPDLTGSTTVCFAKRDQTRADETSHAVSNHDAIIIKVVLSFLVSNRFRCVQHEKGLLALFLLFNEVTMIFLFLLDFMMVCIFPQGDQVLKRFATDGTT